MSNLFQGRLQEKRLSLDVIKPPIEEMAVRGDPNRLRQACFPKCFFPCHNSHCHSLHQVDIYQLSIRSIKCGYISLHSVKRVMADHLLLFMMKVMV